MRIKVPDDAWDFVNDTPPHCPLCGSKWASAPAVLVSEEHGVALVGRKSFRLNRTQGRVLQVLSASYGRWLPPEDILWRAWSDVPDSDVPTTLHPVTTSLGKLRNELEGTPYEIELRRGHGYRLISKRDARKGETGGSTGTQKRRKPVHDAQSARSARTKEAPLSGAARRAADSGRDRRRNRPARG